MLAYGTLSGMSRTLRTNTHISHIFYSQGSLEKFLKEETGVEEEDILAYLPDGRRLYNENIRDLAGAEDQVRADCYGKHKGVQFTATDDICVQQSLP
jgi:hypothetical protein